MNKWSKIERDIIHDSQIRKLIIKHGIKGFGVFVLVRNYVECYDMVSVDALWMQCKGLVRRALFDDVLNLKDLFSIDEEQIVTSVFSPMHARTHMQANMQADKDAERDTDKDTDRDAAVPFNEREKEREEKKKKRESLDDAHAFFIKPSLFEINEYINERNLNLDGERFYSYYESRGWMMGTSPMVDWRAAMKSWLDHPEYQKESSYDETAYINDTY